MLLRRLLLLADNFDNSLPYLDSKALAEELGVAPRPLHDLVSVLESLQVCGLSTLLAIELFAVC